MDVRLEVLGLILMCALVTQVPRILPFLAIQRMQMPAWAVAWLTLLPAAILAALLAPGLFVDEGSIQRDWLSAEILATLVAVAVAVARRNLVATLLAGMLSYALFDNIVFPLI